MKDTGKKTIIFAVTEEELQDRARGYIGRKLNEREMHYASKGVVEGLSFDIDTVFEAAIHESIEAARQT